MAPELFTPEGVHSFQSDMWSMGVLLYELRQGYLPFGDDTIISLEQVMENIRVIDPIQHPVGPSHGSNTNTNTPIKGTNNNNNRNGTPDRNHHSSSSSSAIPTNNNHNNGVSAIQISIVLSDLVQWLLEKAPMNRCSW
jgi:serine/threonine protein kinase